MTDHHANGTNHTNRLPNLAERLDEAREVQQVTFSPELEQAIITYCLDYPEKANQILPNLEPNLFALDPHQYLIAQMCNLLKRYGSAPSRDVLRDTVMKHLTVDDVGYKEVLAVLDRKPAKMEPVWVSEQIKDWTLHKQYGLLYSDDAIAAYHSRDYDRLREVFRKADTPILAEPTAKSFNLCDLIKAHPKLKEPLIDNLLRRGEVANLISVSKVGKSWLVYNLIAAVTRGTPWLERFPTKQSRVLLVDCELHPETLAGRFRSVCSSLKIDPREISEQIEILPIRGLGWTIDDLMSHIAGKTFDLLILDPKYRLIRPGQSENDNATETKFYNDLDHIAGRHNAAILVVHHSAKGNQSDKRTKKPARQIGQVVEDK